MLSLPMCCSGVTNLKVHLWVSVGHLPSQFALTVAATKSYKDEPQNESLMSHVKLGSV